MYSGPKALPLTRQDLGALLEEARQGQARWAKVAHQLYEHLSLAQITNEVSLLQSPLSPRPGLDHCL